MSPIAILTRPAGRNEALAQRLSAAGWHALCLPALAIEPLPADGPLPMPHDYDLAVFVSGNAVRLYLDRLAPHLPQGWPAGCTPATVGAASAQVLEASGLLGAGSAVLHPAADADAHDSEALWNLLSSRPLPRRALLVRGTQGRDWLADRLAGAGVEVTRHAVYRRLPAVWPDGAAQALRRMAARGAAATWLLTSGEGIAATADAVRAADLQAWWRGCRFVVTHPRLAVALRAAAAVPFGNAAAPAVDDAATDMVVQICMPADEAIFEAFVAA
ncbi:uroporphyrinogen-III synthase [Bordetella ansorpii]|uniref:Uroporphyrinogen-III synthase n=1 Tax=Bordetella ansorpii TaxID=288768 RepID=A0A157SNW0_9BORD|nr:uroporphyrinogen-III synthase [Bordetella ansorpii]SAI71974.1 uroporphyrinogen-III synthase [Bordetella ansorpii]